MSWEFLCYLAAFVAFVLAAAGVPSRVNLVALGLALWVLVPTVLAYQAA